MKRATALKSISKLPADFSIDELIEHLVFIDKVEKGLKDSQQGKVHSTKQAKKRLAKWLN